MDKQNAKAMDTNLKQCDTLGKELKKRQEWARARNKLYVIDLEGLMKQPEVDGLYDIGIELLDSKTGEKICYKANSAWINDELEELTITIDVDKLPQIID